MPTKRTITDVIGDIMASLPQTEEFLSHGIPHFRVAKKTFANYTINHHGDGRVALNVIARPGVQKTFVDMDPNVYFVPAYVGPKGWLGIQLDKGLPWATVAEHAREAYSIVAPPELIDEIDTKTRIKAPTRKFRADEIDPLKRERAKAVLKKLDAICESIPETSPGTAFGAPVWKAGKKTFVTVHHYGGRLQVSIWVGLPEQKKLTRDKRFRVPDYTGHNGWIDLDVEDQDDWEEIEPLLLTSYRHFALQRMLKALDA